MFEFFNPLLQIIRPVERHIHVIGDSHVMAFKDNPLFTLHHVGSATAYGLLNPSSVSGGRKNLYALLDKIDKKQDALLLVFGEIDCRIHIYHKYMSSKKSIPISELITKSIQNYGQVITDLRSRGYLVCVYNVVPTGEQGNYYNYPFYANREIRTRITEEFNHVLHNFCNNGAVPFIDIYGSLITEENERKKDYIADEVHLNEKILPLAISQIAQKLNCKLVSKFEKK